MTSAGPVSAADRYIRTDGGDAAQCDGTRDRAVSADGHCAWSHPFFALPPGAEARLAGGDTLHIGPGSYRIGLGAPGAARCSEAFPWDCTMPPLPAGRAGQPTRVLGDCAAKPQLWGAERAQQIFDLSGSDHVELACLELTDHASCVENHCHGGACGGEVARCERERFPYGDWAGTGLRAKSASGVLLRDLDIHGFALRGIHAGGLRDWTLQRVRIVGNGWAGWDGDVGEGSANAGTLRFEDVEIAWNGCVERHPSRQPFGCWGQSSGGYGDGLGTAATGGDWRFERVRVHHNVSDGLDLLYLTPQGRMEVVDSRFEANGGNQLKASHHASVRGSTLLGTCSELRADGLLAGDLCRAGGNALVLKLGTGSAVVEDSELGGEGDCLLVTEGGNADTAVAIRRNRFTGAALWNDGTRTSCGFYAHAGDPALELRDNEFIHTRGESCPADNRCVR
jgi:hypothetical protein